MRIEEKSKEMGFGRKAVTELDDPVTRWKGKEFRVDDHVSDYSGGRRV